jgi:lysophospholipase L1-like esterase
MMHMMAKAKKQRLTTKQKIFASIVHYRRALYVIIPILLIGLYLNTANNHFYHHLHTAGLPWPQNQTSYIIGDGTEKKIAYVALGDSLTSGVGAPKFEESYAYAVAKKINKPNQQIVLTPLSTPGFKSKDIINKYLDRAIALHPDIVTIFIGVNDTHGMSPSTKEFRYNYETIVSRLKNETSAKVYAVAIPYIGANSLIWQPYSSYYNARTKMFNKNILDLTQKYNATYIDLYTVSLPYAYKQSNYYSKDDFHPSAVGYELWAKVIARDISY